MTFSNINDLWQRSLDICYPSILCPIPPVEYVPVVKTMRTRYYHFKMLIGQHKSLVLVKTLSLGAGPRDPDRRAACGSDLGRRFGR